MVGEISPDITFVRIWRICVLMGVGGQICVPKGALGSKDRGGTKNNRKRSKNDRVVCIFGCMAGRKQNRKLAGMVEVVRCDYLREMSAKKGVRVNFWCLNEKIRGQNIGTNAKTHQNQQIHIGSNQTKYVKKTTA